MIPPSTIEEIIQGFYDGKHSVFDDNGRKGPFSEFKEKAKGYYINK